jgi:hypothetical protein
VVVFVFVFFEMELFELSFLSKREEKEEKRG